MSRTFLRLLALLMTIGLFAAACGGGDDSGGDDDGGGDESTTTTTEAEEEPEETTTTTTEAELPDNDRGDAIGDFGDTVEDDLSSVEFQPDRLVEASPDLTDPFRLVTEELGGMVVDEYEVEETD